MQTLQKMKILGVECYGIMMPKTAELPQTAPRVFEGWWYRWHSIHSDGNPNVLNANRNGDGRRVGVYCDNPDDRWYDNGLFAFSVLETLFISRPCLTTGASLVL